MSLAAQTDRCAIRGKVTDPTGAVIGKALISVYPKGSALLAFRGNANYDDGTFCITGLSAGTYTINAWYNGFRRNLVRDVAVRAHEATNIGTVQLEVGGCDAPGVSCFFITPLNSPSQPDQPVDAVRAHLKLPRECGIDLIEEKVICSRPEGSAGDTDVVFLEEHGALILRPANGARIQPDCRGAYGDQSLRVEGLGNGDDLCVKTGDGYISHLFFEGDDVQSDTAKLTLWIVTKK
ncbi:MAG: carboxypeptidase-like regulatory domain-containing protein [Bryobacteraceae bacterium]